MRTKIIATLGPASTDYDIMKNMVANGVRIFRLNFSHANAASFTPVIKLIRQLENDLNTPLTALGDLCGPKTRIGEVVGSPLSIDKSGTVVLGLPDLRDKAPDFTFVELDFPELLKGLDVGMPVSLSDGMLQFKVSKVLKADQMFELKALNGGILTSNKGITFPGKFHPLPALTDKDRVDLHEGLEIGLDAVAISFVQTRQDIQDAKVEIARHGTWIPVVAKLERQNAVDNLDSILSLADVIMVARGDLGLECPLSQLPVIQKRIIRACRHAQKSVIVATQMLLSMVKNPMPTRAESTDVANAMLDGADCVMLSEETAIGQYPAESVQFINQIAQHTEAYFLERIQGPYAPKKEKNPAKYLAYAACLLADNTDSTAIVSHSTHGATARLLSSRRVAQPIYALTPKTEVVRAMNFFWGVRPQLVSDDLPNHMDRSERFIVGNQDFKPGQSLVITSGQPTPGQTEQHTNSIKVYNK